MGINTKIGKVAAATYSAPATTVTAEVITWTTNEPTVSYTPTVADGSAPTSTELGVLAATHNAQITALIADMVAMKAAVAQVGVDNAAMLAQLNAGE